MIPSVLRSDELAEITGDDKCKYKFVKSGYFHCAKSNRLMTEIVSKLKLLKV